jgi:hypothetical protein
MFPPCWLRVLLTQHLFVHTTKQVVVLLDCFQLHINQSCRFLTTNAGVVTCLLVTGNPGEPG